MPESIGGAGGAFKLKIEEDGKKNKTKVSNSCQC
jgi:hypothetical protein